MPIKLFLRITSVITTLLGLTLILFPAFIENNFIAHPSHGGDVFIRFLGSTLFGYACLNWFTAIQGNKAAIRVTAAANLATLSVAFVISLVALIDGTFSAWGILIVLLHFIFALGFATYVVSRRLSR